MEKNKIDYSLYAITDRSWLNRGSLEDAVKDAIIGGASVIQLREKNVSTEEYIEIAKRIKEVCKTYNATFIINDNVEVMLITDADGVHVGQGDMNYKDVRKLIGNDKILGVSARTKQQAIDAYKAGADYLGVGAVFKTSTKLDAADVSFDTLKEICKSVKIPVIAIGGINTSNIELLKNSGIKGVAVVSAIFKANDIKTATIKLKKKVSEIL